jgi:hypothetical protein
MHYGKLMYSLVPAGDIMIRRQRFQMSPLPEADPLKSPKYENFPLTGGELSLTLYSAIKTIQYQKSHSFWERAQHLE